MSEFHLYRHFDANGALLYVGQSNNCFERFQEHRQSSDWTTLSVVMRIERFESRKAALAAERQAIFLEKPRFNDVEMEKKCHRLELCGPRSFFCEVDEWRRRQPDIPSRNEAIIRLTEQALSASAGKKR